MLGLINQNFRHMSISTFVALCKSMVRSYYVVVTLSGHL